jgi:hypothetical protein
MPLDGGFCPKDIKAYRAAAGLGSTSEMGSFSDVGASNHDVRSAVCTENLSSGVVVVKSAKDGV